MQNAADRNQVKTASQLERRRDERRQSDLKTVLGTTEGRRIFLWLIEEMQPRVPYWSPNAAAVGFQAARHDVGTWLKDRIEELGPELLSTMLIEAEAQRREDVKALHASKTKPKSDNSNESGEETD